MPEYIPLLGASRFEVVGELAVATRKRARARVRTPGSPVFAVLFSLSAYER
jgi:hypothetical protein